MQQLTLNKLKDYNLFSNKNNTLILRALLISKTEIKAYLKNSLPNNISIHLSDHHKKQITNFDIFSSENHNIISLKGKFEFNVNYTLKINDDQINVILDPKINGILDTDFYSDNTDFGLTLINNSAHFKLWSPPAVRAELILYDQNQNEVKTPEALLFKNTKSGIWEYLLKPENIGLNTLNEIYYQYKIFAYDKVNIALDPYAKSMRVFDSNSIDKIGKAAIIDFHSSMANPSDFKRIYNNYKFIANDLDIIVYEINIRDFTIQPGIVDNIIAGTFKGLIEKIDYLKELGITHIQLMPINKAYTQNELNKTYTGKSAKESNYNWGYDPMNYFTLEGRYSTNPHNPYMRIREFKEMVQALHNAGIGVILDIVFNHTYIADTFENIAPGCYYRLTDDYKISGHTGAGASIESRHRQVRKFIIDVLKFFVQEYHIDGFRFDLMSFTDKETMHQIRKEVGLIYNPNDANELILHGEAWNFTDLEKNAFIKTDFDSLNIGIFNDSIRDAIAGTGHSKGFIQGNLEETSRLASAIIGGVNSYDSNGLPFNKNVFFDPYNLFAKDPGDCLNFVSVHDGLTLWDKINLSMKDASKTERLRLMKFAYAILFTSQGKIIMHGGDEILRTKPLADFDKEKHRAQTSDSIDIEEDTRYFHENSYCSNDYTNMFRWDRLSNEFSEYANELLEYIKGLIKMRRNISAFRFEKTEDINKHIRFLFDVYSDESKIHSFKSHKIKDLKLKFKNGKAGEKYYLVGEVHKNNANPTDNPFILSFDKKGYAEIKFNKKNINNFDLQKWDNNRNLNFKLVKTPGNWDYLDFAYTDFGHNSIIPESINENSEIEIDLGIKNFNNDTYQSEKTLQSHIAYMINFKNKKKGKSINKMIYKKFIVIHNSSKNRKKIRIEEIIRPDDWHVILDIEAADIKNIKSTHVIIENRFVTIPKMSSAVIASY